MDWKRQMYIYQSRQTRGKLKLSWKSSVTCHRDTALYPTAGKGKASGQVRPAGPRGTGGPRSISAHQGVRLVVLSEASLTLEVQHVLPKEAKRNKLVPELTQPVPDLLGQKRTERDPHPLLESSPLLTAQYLHWQVSALRSLTDGINSGFQQKLL